MPFYRAKLRESRLVRMIANSGVSEALEMLTTIHGVSYSDQYAERGLFQRLMDCLRNITPGEANFAPLVFTPLRA